VTLQAWSLGLDETPSPASPFAFQGLLRAERTGLATDSLDATAGERAVMLRF
jgi:hypothetical protein